MTKYEIKVIQYKVRKSNFVGLTVWKEEEIIT